MEGRFPKCLLYALTNCKDSAQEADFNQWYNEIHLPDIVASGLFQNPMRFVRAVSLPDDQEARYLATYEGDSDDPADLMQELEKLGQRLTEQGRCHPAAEGVFLGMFRRFEGAYWSRRYNQQVAGVVMNRHISSDPARGEEVGAWFDNQQLADALSSGFFLNTYRYKAVDPQPGWGDYLAVYETHMDVVDALAKFDHRMKNDPRAVEFYSKRPETLQVLSRVPYRRIYPPV